LLRTFVLASPAISRLRECIEAGRQCKARVPGKRDAMVRVRVTAVSGTSISTKW
jgi:hypothetical protein